MLSRPRMFSLLFFVVLCATCLAKPTELKYSNSKAVGEGSGTPFSIEGTGRIIAIRVWEISGAYITGIQLKSNGNWSNVVGRTLGIRHEMELFPGESIVQVSGKCQNNYIYRVMFTTSKRRFMTAGRPSTTSFNFYPKYPETELKMLSGHYNGNGITSLAAHWGEFSHNYTDSGDLEMTNNNAA